jgi:hypothetical protein
MVREPGDAATGIFGRLTRGLLNVPSKTTEDLAAGDLGGSVTVRPVQKVVNFDKTPPCAEPPSNRILRWTLDNGGDTSRLTTAILKETGDEGDRAIQILHDNDVQVIYRKGGGYAYDHPARTVYVDLDLAGLGPQIVHEATHAEYANGPLRAAASGGDFVDLKLSEETEAIVRQARGNAVLQRANRFPGLPESPLQYEFEERGSPAVLEALRNGAVVPSTMRGIVAETGLRQTYPEALAEFWNRHH